MVPYVDVVVAVTVMCVLLHVCTVACVYCCMCVCSESVMVRC